jgi:hypothetical protein
MILNTPTKHYDFREANYSITHLVPVWLYSVNQSVRSAAVQFPIFWTRSLGWEGQWTENVSGRRWMVTGMGWEFRELCKRIQSKSRTTYSKRAGIRQFWHSGHVQLDESLSLSLSFRFTGALPPVSSAVQRLPCILVTADSIVTQDSG